jgi:WD40 repeat protein
VLDARTGASLHSLEYDRTSGWPSTVAVSEQGRFVVALSSPIREPGTLVWWDTRTGMVRRRPGPVSTPFAVAIDAGGRFVTAGRADGSLEVWDMAGDAHWSVPAHTGNVTGIAQLPGTRVASVGSDGKLTIWNLPSLRRLATIDVEHSLTCLATTAGGDEFLVGDNWGNVHSVQLVRPTS